MAGLDGKDADFPSTRPTADHVGGKRRGQAERLVPGYPNGPDAPLRATAEALERAEHARSIVLVEGISDQIAIETLAKLQARDLTKEGVVVVPIGGAHSVTKFLEKFGPHGLGRHVSGLCDATEARYFCRQLARTGYIQSESLGELERAGFFVCDRDLEDELIRAVGPAAIETILAEERDLGSFHTLQQQAAWRDAGFTDQLRRFLSAGARRKLRYAGLFVRALDLNRQPQPLLNVLSRA